mgnify:CR=1 FL=1
MLQYLKNEANLTHTENGAVTYQSTQSECLDLFATIGAIRRESDEEITNRFLCAYAENADLAMKTQEISAAVSENAASSVPSSSGLRTMSLSLWKRTSPTLQSMDAMTISLP